MWLGLVALLGLPGKTAFANRRGFSHFMLLLSFFFFSGSTRFRESLEKWRE